MENPDYLLASYNYDLPKELIAQSPMVPRDHSRLLHVDRGRNIAHYNFHDLPSLLQAGDLLIFNDTQVIPARWYGQKMGGSNVEILLVEPTATDRWLTLIKPAKRLQVGDKVEFEGGVWATVLEIDQRTRGRILQFHFPADQTMEQAMNRLGMMPLPPYINQSYSTPDQYQTVYAQNLGAVAAPTAGLHFTDRLLQDLQAQGIELAWLTLHVGIGTFRPVETPNITEHQMHHEWCQIPESVEQAIKRTRDRGGRVIGVGTTVARSIESSGGKSFCGKTNLMIYPGFEWQVLDGLITNFHLPRSSLMMLVSSFLGNREFLLDVYRLAIGEGYRFYSFGDATFLWR